MNAYLITLDPGLRGCGMAWFDETGRLIAAQYARNTVKTDTGPKAWAGYFSYGRHVANVFLSEVPQVYRAGASKGDPDDLIQLAGVVGVFTAIIEADEYLGVKPREWKGQVPKAIHHARLVKTLTPEEMAMVERAAPPSLRHNVLDAIGIGRYFFEVRRRDAQHPGERAAVARANPVVEKPVRMPRRRFTR